MFFVPEDTNHTISDHIHLGTPIECLDTTVVQQQVIPSEEDAYINLVRDFFHGVRNEYVRTQLAANEEMEMFQSMIDRLGGGCNAETLLSGELGDDDPLLLNLGDVLRELNPAKKQGRKRGRDDEGGIDFPAFRFLRCRYELCFRLSKEKLVDVDEMVQQAVDETREGEEGMGSEDIGEGLVHVKSLYICTPGDDSVAGKTTWDEVFRWQVEGNPITPSAEADEKKEKFKGSKSKKDKEEEKQSVKLELGLENRRETTAGSVNNGTVAWIELVEAHFRDGQVPALIATQTEDAQRVLYADNGYPRNGMGPWHNHWVDCDALYPLTLGKVFSHPIAKCMRTRDTRSNSYMIRPRYPLQMHWEAYVVDDLRGNDHRIQQLARDRGSDPHRKGVNYLAAFGGDEEACARNVFRNVNAHLLTPWSHIDSACFPYVWRNLDEISAHSTNGTCVQIARDSIFARETENITRVSSAGLTHAHATMAQAMSRGCFTEGEERIDLTATPVDPVAASVNRRNKANLKLVEGLREGRANLTGAQFRRLAESVIPPRDLHLQSTRTLFLSLKHTQRMCPAAKAVVAWGLDKANGLCGKMPSRPYRTRSVAPDMSMLSNAQQRKMLSFEMFGTACLHPIMLLMWQSVLVAMMMHTGIYTNILLYGSHALGKSYAVFMMKKLMIEGSLVEEQESTDKAHRNMMPATFFQVTAMHELGGSGMTGGNGKSGKPQEGEKEKVQVLKTILTENACAFVTLLPISDSGRRKVALVCLKKFGCFWAATNIANLYEMVEHALLSRFIHVPVSDIHRVGSNATDKAGYESLRMTDFETREEKATARLAFRHEQWFVAAMNALVNAGILTPPTETAFQCILASISMGLCDQFDYTLETRLVQQAQRVATANMYIELFERVFAREYSMFGCDHEFVPQDLLALDSLLTVSSAAALSAIRQVIVPKMCKLEVKSIATAILRWIRENGKFYEMFAAETAPLRRPVDTHDVALRLDFGYVRFPMDRRKFASEVIKLNMPNDNKYNSKQIEGYLCELFGLGTVGEDAESLFAKYPDKPMNIQIKDGDIAEFWGSEVARARRSNEGHTIELSDIKAVETKWRSEGATTEIGELGSCYFPFVDEENGVRQSGSEGKSGVARIPTMIEERDGGAPCIKVSTAWLTHVTQQGWTARFDATVSGDNGLSHSTPGFFATSATAGLAVDAQHPYLLTTCRTSIGQKSLKIKNQHYRPAGAHRAIGGGARRTKYQETEYICVPAGLPLDTYCAVQRVNTIITDRDWFTTPTAHYLFNADWASGANQRLGPYILRLCMNEHPIAFACPDAVYADCGMCDAPGSNGGDPCPNRAERQAIAIAALRQHVPDFLRPVDPCDPGHTERITYDDADDDEAERFTNELADVIVDLSLVARAGMLRVLSRLDGGPAEGWQESVYRNSDLESHAKREDWHFETFADEWESFLPDLDKTLHYGPGYIQHIRTEARRLWDERQRRDGKWLNDWQVQNGMC